MLCLYIWKNHAICLVFSSYIIPYKLLDIMFISMKRICLRNPWNHFSVNWVASQLYPHLNDILFIMHLKHSVIFSCHASLFEQVGCSGCKYIPCCSRGLSSGIVSFRMFYLESSKSSLLCCIVRQIIKTKWFVMCIKSILVFHSYVINVVWSIEIQ